MIAASGLRRCHMLGIALVSLALTSCTTGPNAADASSDGAQTKPESWAGQCYEGFAQDIDAIAGVDALDCGFIDGMKVSAGAKTQWRACARAAAATGRPFKFGYRDMGIDSAYCDTAVRTPEGDLITWYFDYDLTGGAPEGPKTALWALRCADIGFDDKALGPPSFFDMFGCEKLDSGRAWGILQARLR
jgi:hypothetical protein